MQFTVKLYPFIEICQYPIFIVYNYVLDISWKY